AELRGRHAADPSQHGVGLLERGPGRRRVTPIPSRAWSTTSPASRTSRSARAPTANAEYWGWNDPAQGGEMYAMCSLVRTTRRARLAQELYPRGPQAHSSRLAQLRASGSNPSPGFFEPRPSVKLVDLDADGLADLVVSTLLHGPRRNFD